MSKSYSRNIERAALIQKTADITGVSVRHVRRVLESEKKNETIVEVYMTLSELSNQLVDEVKRIVPIPSRKQVIPAK